MKPSLIFETLYLRAKQIDQGEATGQDEDTRVVVAASLALLKQIARETATDVVFDFESDAHKALLIRGIYRLNPNANFDEWEQDAIAVLREYSE